MHLSQQFFKVNILNKHKILDKLPKNRVDLHLFENIDSTNEECKRIDQNKDFHVVIAEKQTMGKGRLGKIGLVQVLVTFICQFIQKN